MRKSKLEQFRDSKASAGGSTQEMGLEDLIKLCVAGHKPEPERIINPTQQAFIFDPARVKGYMGPRGNAKTTTLITAGFLRALLQPGSKGLVGRYDYNKLMDTTKGAMEEMLRWLPKGILLDRDKSAPEKWWIQSVPQQRPDGTINDAPSMITFMGLKDAMGSMELNWAIVDEAAEVDESAISWITSSFRYERGGGDYSLMLAFNPPPKTHWLYTACTGKDFQGRKVKAPYIKLYRPRPAENTQNLPTNYYENMRATMTDDMALRLVDGEWGNNYEGQPVYREFKYNFHCPAEGVHWDGHSPLVRFWDFGYNHPCCIWAFVDYYGRLKILRAVVGDKVEASEFIKRCLSITSTHYPDCEIAADFGDPAVKQKKDTGQTLAVFAKAGITIRFKTSKIDQGIQACRQLLSRTIEGEPAVQFDRTAAAALIESLQGGYRLDDKGEKPVKDNIYDHAADAFRYGVINLFTGDLRVNSPSSYRDIPRSVEYDPKYDIPNAFDPALSED